MKILFIGGNGNISWWCVQKAIEAGHTVYELNRGASLKTRKEIQPEVIKLTGNFRNKSEISELINDLEFDVVCDFICFNAEQAILDIQLFNGKTKQFVFISSCGVYKQGYGCLPFRETSTQWDSNEFPYAVGKQAAEKVFLNAYEQSSFPITIVRPSYTYDTIVPVSIGHNCFTAPKRYLDGKPVLIAGDGTNVFSFIHSRDFARAFVGILGNNATIGEVYHIANDVEMLNWLDITNALLDALNIKKRDFVHIPAKDILNIVPKTSQNMAISYLGKQFACDRMWCSVIDCSKIKNTVPGWKCETPYSQGIAETVSWLMEKPERQRFTPEIDNLMEELTQKYQR